MIRTISAGAARLAALALVLLSANVALAQGGNFSPEAMRQRFEEQNKALITELALTEAQTPKFTEIMNAALEARMKLYEGFTPGGGGDFQGMREKMVALDEETTKKLADVLNEEQLARYSQIQQERRNRRPGGGTRPS